MQRTVGFSTTTLFTIHVLLLSIYIAITTSQQVTYYQTSWNTTDRLTQKPSLSFTPIEESQNNRITIDRTKLYQKILGFGGAFTDAAAVTFASLKPDLQKQVLELYWGETGIGYSIGRVHMNSCDFSLYSYNFDDVEDDKELLFFDTNVTHDTISMIPLIQRANQTFIQTQNAKKEAKTKQSSSTSSSSSSSADIDHPHITSSHPHLHRDDHQNENKEESEKGYVKPEFPAEGLRIFLTPWSPPGWMKVPVNGKQSMDGSATPNGLLDQYHYTWSLYFVKFIEAYLSHNITLWGLTVQNEPEYAAYYEACVFTSENERNLIVNQLGPMLQKKFPYVKILAYDHNRDDVFAWAQEMYSNPSSNFYVDGIAFHWYITQQFQNVNATYNLDPSKILFGSEACNCPMSPSYNMTNDWFGWQRGESYGQDIIGDLSNFAQGWTDWNLILNAKGGPNHAKNYCDAPLVADLESQALYVQITYYYMGHLSKFLLPDYQRVDSTSSIQFSSSPVLPNHADDQPDVVFLFDGMNSVLWDCQYSPQQQFIYQNSALILNNTNQCLNIENNNSDDGANIQLWQFYSGSENEMWTIDSNHHQIVSSLNQKCIQVANSSLVNGANIQMITCDDNDLSQQWIYNELDGSIRSMLDQSKCITAGWSPLLNVAFVSDDNSEVVVVVMNPTNQRISFDIYDPLISTTNSISTSIPPHSIQTYLYPLN